ncbi:hypothetical protein CRG98_034036 [Punica granatum]|uniref:Uncharacterized protein n=1 Tax=Punica granatum TaxID=22663 RepID=A0A2I0INC9_PUNGR|nr:hypothetical protein CRG98_034036 [Punica granatum]
MNYAGKDTELSFKMQKSRLCFIASDKNRSLITSLGARHAFLSILFSLDHPDLALESLAVLSLFQLTDCTAIASNPDKVSFLARLTCPFHSSGLSSRHRRCLLLAVRVSSSSTGQRPPIRGFPSKLQPVALLRSSNPWPSSPARPMSKLQSLPRRWPLKVKFHSPNQENKDMPEAEPASPPPQPEKKPEPQASPEPEPEPMEISE